MGDSSASAPAKSPTPEEMAFLQYQMSVKDQTLQPNFYASVGVCMVLAYVSVVLRLLARRRKSQKLMADDWWIIGALVPTTLWDVFNFWSIKSGLGLHIIRVTDAKAFIQSAVGCMILYALCLPPVKFSILLFYHRIFPSKTIKNISIVIAAIVAGAAIASSIAFGLQCIPLSSLWDGTHGQCLELSPLAMSTGVINIVTDVAILALPIKSLIQLKASTKVRLGLVATFLLGGCVCIFSIIRTTIVGQASQDDPSWSNASPGMWSVIEVHVAIISANLPVLKPLFFKDRQQTTANSYGKPMIKSSGYIRSDDYDSQGSKKTSKARGPFSITNNSMWENEDDQMPLHDIELGHGKISKSTHVDVRSVPRDNVNRPQNPGSAI
ncbi:hypothetical protein P171DRAFT_427513 [Karstenula rhodostoma CBS 690.94]|uniref:Rhodopsin domain-containing protein n=1 Tax=Karstenula rhodostoma CBS 690.94 TaxID=1392251 RepID=A0A9P4PSC9_9PLEO|nr:hypothetical protein P171DRAFT_427513 [Karstenula rhodostoma CBS 690.94]